MKKVLGIILALAMVLVMLTACSPEEEPAKATVAPATAAPTAEPTAAPTEEPVAEPVAETEAQPEETAENIIETTDDSVAEVIETVEQPAVEEPAATEAPAEEPAVTEAPAEEPAVTEAPATEAPAEEPAAEAPAEEPVVADAPAAEEAPAEAAATEEAPAEEPKGAYAGKTVILHSNDVHGAIEGYAYIKAQKDAFEAEGANVILVDAGDFSQGTVYVSSSKGAAAVDMMNAAGYDVVTLGNHEFDFGYAQLMENLSKAEFQVICADVVNVETKEAILPGFTVVEKNGLKVGFFGMETPETATKVNPGLIKEIDFNTFDAMYGSAQKAIDDAKAAGADLVIGLVHLGVDAESAANGNRSIDLLGKVNGVDFLIDGHSHTVMTEGDGGTAIQSTGTAFAYIGVVVIDNETKAIEDHYLMKTTALAEGETLPEGVKVKLPEGEALPKDETVAAKAQEIIAAVDAEYSATFATTEVLLNGERDPGNRTQETNLGDLITDAMVWSVTKEAGALNDEIVGVVGITNGGGIRATIQAGEISKKDINTVLPFGNTVAVIYVKGSELLEAMEASTFSTPTAIGGYPQTSGMKWTVDTTKAYDAQDSVYVVNDKETTYYGPKSINRVTIEKIGDADFNPDGVYAVVTNNFIAAGGDTYAIFARAYAEGSGFDTGIPMDEAVMDYVKDVLNGNITAEAYGEPAGRETQILAAPETEAPAEEPAATEAPAAEAPAEEPAATEAPAAEAPAEEPAAETAVEAVEEIVEQAAENENVTEAVEEAAEAVEEAAAEEVNQVTEEANELISELTEEIEKPAEEIAEEAVQAVEEAIEEGNEKVEATAENTVKLGSAQIKVGSIKSLLEKALSLLSKGE